MHKHVTFRNMDHSPVMEEYANKQMERIEKFLTTERSPIYILLILEPSKIHAHHRVELRVKSPRFHIITKYEGPNFYEVLDRVIDVTYNDLLNGKAEYKDDIKTQGRRFSPKCWWEGMEGSFPKELIPKTEEEEEEDEFFEEE